MFGRFLIVLACLAGGISTAAFAANGSVLALESTPDGVRMLRDGKVLWHFHLDVPEGRPFFHPLALPGGRTFTDVRPKDHVWHLGAWFSWKYVNGVNYWEPADAKRQGYEPDGRTHVIAKEIRREGLACTVRLTVEYGPRSASHPVLREERTVKIEPPDENGGYAMTSFHRFTALDDVTLDRTPPHGDVKKGKWGGGYAGPTLRLTADMARAFHVRGSEGADSPATVTGCERSGIELFDPQTGEGLTFRQLKAPPASRFYLWPDKRMINASPVYLEPLTVRKDETLELAYSLKTWTRPCARTAEDDRMSGQDKRKDLVR